MRDKKAQAKAFAVFCDGYGRVWRAGYYTPTQTRMIVLRYAQTGIMVTPKPGKPLITYA